MRQVRVDLVQTPAPSPMAAGILFKFVSIYLYEEDQSRSPRRGLTVGSEILATLLNNSRAPAILTPEIILQAERRWQHLDPHFQAATAEDLFSIITKLGPLDKENLACRCKVDVMPLLHELKKAGRIALLAEQQHGDPFARTWQVAEKITPESGSDHRTKALPAVQRYLQSRGPVDINAIETDLGLPQHLISGALNRLLAQKQVICGRLIEGLEDTQWCDRHNFTRLYRTAVARRRVVQNPAGRTAFLRFLLQWHGIGGTQPPLSEIIGRYRGLRFPIHFFEREVLRSRYRAGQQAAYADRLAELEARISGGEIIACAGPLKSEVRSLLRQKNQLEDGRWFLTTLFGVLGKPEDAGKRIEWQTRLLLERYGILVKEWYRREQGLLPWYPIFQTLKRMEWQGEIRRGYFIAGLSGV